jgi:hypothetical protein
MDETQQRRCRGSVLAAAVQLQEVLVLARRELGLFAA